MRGWARSITPVTGTGLAALKGLEQLAELELARSEVNGNELTNLAGERTDVLKAHRKRVDELVIKFSSDERSTQRRSEEDLDRVRALGYLE